MLDVRLIRNELDEVKAAVARRGSGTDEIDRIYNADIELRKLAAQRDGVRGEIRSISNEVGKLFREGLKDEAADLQAESKRLGESEKQLNAQADTLESEIRELLLGVPNMPAPEAPDGAGEADNVVLKVVDYDESNYGAHQRVPHWDIGDEHGILDVQRAVKISGAMFVMYRKAGASLVRALCQLAIDRNSDLYEEIRPPTLVTTATMTSTGHLPKFDDDAFAIERDDLWAIPTAEVPLTSLGKDEIVNEADLPQRFVAHTSCFRREAGSAGKDTRGLLRVHEFDKVELLAYATPEQAQDMHQEIFERAESIIVDLGLAYRVLDLCAGDIGASSARTYDIEVYAPGVDRWLEVSSVSWFRDYQARRANLRYRPESGSGTQILHTLNGSALAVPRVWAALVETYRQEDGRIAIPELLQPYMRGATHIG